MDHETRTQTRNYQTKHQCGRLPKGERRVRFADSMGMELVSIFLFDLIRHAYLDSFHSSQKCLQAPPPSTHSLQMAARSLQKQPLAPTLHHNNNNNNHHQHNNNKYSTINNNNNNNNIKSTDNNNNNKSNSISNSSSNQKPATYICEFTQPISLISFKERVKLSKVQLETCQISSVSASNASVSCTIRVLNVSFDKSVLVRYTTDDWRTHTDSLASYKPASSDGWSDKFNATFGITSQPGQRIIFAIRYLIDGHKVHWDNNGGLNYSIKMC